MAEPDYVFHGVEDRRELERLHAIERACDPSSRRRLLATGLSTGWSCLEVGPGAGSILHWLSEVVGPGGRVVGLDLSTKFLPRSHPRHVEIRQGDVRAALLPAASFDLVHARYVLIHLPDYEVALTRMLACLKPGGWLVLEEPDFSAARPVAGPPDAAGSVEKVNRAIGVMYERLGMDWAVGLKLPALIQRHGMRELLVENEAPLAPGGSGLATVMRLSAGQLRDRYLATGVVTEADLERYGRFAEDPETWAIYYATVAVSARKAAR